MKLEPSGAHNKYTELTAASINGGLIIQPKLTIGAVDDPLEHEADTMADKVMRMPEPNFIQRKCSQCEDEEAQRKPLASFIQKKEWGTSYSTSDSTHSGIQATRGGGSAMPANTRTFMENRMGADFSGVRIHSGGYAAQLSNELNAQAFTVGKDIYFNNGKYSPDSSEGKRLLAHELTHTVQQGATSFIEPKMVQLKGGSIGGFFRNIGRAIVSIFTDEPDFSDAELLQYLTVIDAGSIEGDYISDDKARMIVKRWMRNTPGFILSQQRKVLLIREMLSGFTGNADEQAILNLIGSSSDADITFILAQIPVETLRDKINGSEHDELEYILKGWQSRTGAILPNDLFRGTNAVTETQHVNVEHVLNPTTTIIPAGPPIGGGPPPPPVIVAPPPMTGKGPGGTFETQMLAMLNTNVGGWATEFRTLRLEPGQPAFPIRSGNRVADAAQAEAERYFSPFIRVASRKITDLYHPGGSYSLTAKLGDASTRPLTNGNREGWLNYFATLRAPDCYSPPCGQSILDAHKFLLGRDTAELNRVINKYMAAPAHITDIDDTIHGWEAEAGSGTVFIQPYKRIPDDKTKRKERWKLFTTLIHEFMHVLMHPNFEAAADTIGGTAQKVLVEGFAEVMRTELWSGAGKLRARIPSDELAPLREQVEGKRYYYADDVVQDSGYYDQLADAQKIDAEVGHVNAKSAFFLGHVELLGLGTGTITSSGVPLGNIATYKPTDSRDAHVIVAVAGDTYANLITKTGASPGSLINDATSSILPAGAAIAAGTRIRIAGIQWISAIAGDTLGTVAQQHNVTVPTLAKANGFPAGAGPATTLIAGRRVLIPVH